MARLLTCYGQTVWLLYAIFELFVGENTHDEVEALDVVLSLCLIRLHHCAYYEQCVRVCACVCVCMRVRVRVC